MRLDQLSFVFSISDGWQSACTLLADRREKNVHKIVILGFFPHKRNGTKKFVKH